MNITCRKQDDEPWDDEPWDDETLESIRTGTNRYMTTVFMNKKTFSTRSMKFYPPLPLRRTYLCEWRNQDDPSKGTGEIAIYATDKKMLKRFLKAEYTRLPDFISERITTYRDVRL